MSDEALIAFLPSDGTWVKQDFPHMTLVYAGSIEGREMSEFNTMGKDAITAARTIGSFSLAATGVEEFGEEPDKIDVITLYPTPQLLVARRIVEDWDQSEFDFKPHVTIGPAGSAYSQQTEISTDHDYSYKSSRRDTLPNTIYFNRLAICWGEKRLIFNLNNFD